MVFRRRSLNALRPVHRLKHVVDVQGALPGGTTVTNDLILTKDAPVLANTTEVETGCTVNGIYLKVEVYATAAAALSNCYMAVYKNPGGNLAALNPQAIGPDDDKRYVIHQEMVMMQQVTNGNPRTIFVGVIAIPRGFRRFGPNDELQIALKSPGPNANYCFQCIYKEFR